MLSSCKASHTIGNLFNGFLGCKILNKCKITKRLAKSCEGKKSSFLNQFAKSSVLVWRLLAFHWAPQIHQCFKQWLDLSVDSPNTLGPPSYLVSSYQKVTLLANIITLFVFVQPVSFSSCVQAIATLHLNFAPHIAPKFVFLEYIYI